ncbi:MAG: Mut7-C RNAse domain-containing protein, partial [Bacteroidales bacterium]
KINQTVKDAIESMGVPHTEIDLILANGKSVDFSYQLKNGDRIAVYPVFESLDIKPLHRLHPEPLRETRFVLDVHLGKLCKYLRMLGFDTFYRNDLDDEEIMDISLKEHRIILTRDLGILKNGVVTHGYWLRSQDSREQLKEVIRRFQLQHEIRPFHRCIVCNGFVEKVDKKQIAHLLRDNTKKVFKQFFRCSSCRKIYWEGSHYESMREFIDELMKG